VAIADQAVVGREQVQVQLGPGLEDEQERSFRMPRVGVGEVELDLAGEAAADALFLVPSRRPPAR
jgi:hypothetical protein